MKTFKDLKFKKHPHIDGIISRITFDNGYGASVVKHEFSYGGPNGLYNDVIGYLRPQDVTDVMEKIQQL